MLDNVNRVQFSLGLLVVFVAAALLLLDVIESGVAGAMGIIGLGGSAYVLPPQGVNATLWREL